MLLLFHHCSSLSIAPPSVRVEAPGTPHPDLLSVLSRHSNVRQVYSGHYHRGLVWGPLYAFPFTTLPAVRYDSDNFFLLHLARDGSQHQCVNSTANCFLKIFLIVHLLCFFLYLCFFLLSSCTL